MDKKELLRVFDQQQRIDDASFPGACRDVAGPVIRVTIPDEGFGFIPYSTLNEENADAEIEMQIRFFAQQGVPEFEWKVYDHDQPADLRQRLAARGFEVEDPEALMVLDLENAPEFFWTMEIPSLRRIVDAEGVDDIRWMEEEVWGTDHSWMATRLVNDLIKVSDQLSIFAAEADGRVVSTAWVYYHPPTQFASLWGGSTLPAYRRRGYYTALLVARAREARGRGFRFLTVDASPMSRPILEKHGFQFLCFSTPCTWKYSGQQPDGGEVG